ncbi:hypothetical protein PK98_07225 [Croceibacterium mercuriale]|uniref:Uncharacterized protein n=1 Tax=Croceibacterium mercuriale TaxID=1572751 RepID=A0A0B2BXG0_9SPHN|nr:hypothetical protein PK98_07225 [Croceibacterium mercuriale]
MLLHVRRRLTGERWIAGTDPFTTHAVAGGAGDQSALRVALLVQRGGKGRRAGRRQHAADLDRRSRRQGGVVIGQPYTRLVVQPAGDPAHLGVVAGTVVVVFHLLQEIATIHGCQPRHRFAIPLPLQAVTHHTGAIHAGIAAALGDHFARRLERPGLVLARTAGACDNDGSTQRGLQQIVVDAPHLSGNRRRFVPVPG